MRESTVPDRAPLAAEPLLLTADGGRFEVRRSWPGGKGVRSFECLDGGGRIRALTDSPVSGLTVLPHARDRKLPSLRPGGELIVHRAGKRAVVRTLEGFVKHLRAGKAPAVRRASEAMGALAGQAGFRAPEVVSWDGFSVTSSAVPGIPLLGLDDAAWARAWRLWAESWARLVRTPVPGSTPSDGQWAWDVHDAAAEADVVAMWFARLRAFDPGGLASACASRAAEAEEAACVRLRALPVGSEPVVAHRDLHDGQMLYRAGDSRVGLLDFDTAVRADRELDLANLDVHMDLRVLQGALSRSRAEVAREAIAHVAAAVGADEERLAAYRQASTARLACVYAFRPQWVPLARRLLLNGVRERG